LGLYSTELGFYQNLEGENWDIKETFFEKSVLRFLKRYIGPSLKNIKNNQDIWLSPEDLETYKNQNAELRRHFNVFAYLPEGHKFARQYIEKGEYTFENLGNMIRNWIKTPRNLEENFVKESEIYMKNKHQKEIICALAPYFLLVLSPVDFAVRFINNGEKKGFNMKTLSETARHHLYDHVLYYVRD
jgi:hypothetical protein